MRITETQRWEQKYLISGYYFLLLRASDVITYIDILRQMSMVAENPSLVEQRVTS